MSSSASNLPRVVAASVGWATHVGSRPTRMEIDMAKNGGKGGGKTGGNGGNWPSKTGNSSGGGRGNAPAGGGKK